MSDGMCFIILIKHNYCEIKKERGYDTSTEAGIDSELDYKQADI